MLKVDDLSRNYDTVVVGASDIHGQLVGRHIPVRHFLDNPERNQSITSYTFSADIAGRHLEGTSYTGRHTGWHNVFIRPDLNTLRPYPGVPGKAICIGDVVDAAGELVAIAPRTILRRQIEYAQRMGYTLRMAPELEFYLFKGDAKSSRLRKFQGLEPTNVVRAFYGVVRQSTEEAIIDHIREEMEAADIPICSSEAEFGLGQWEVNLEYAQPLEMADRHTIYKVGVKEMALQSGLTATFMAKPSSEDSGSSCHMHCSLYSEGRPVFVNSMKPGELSDVGKSFIAGLSQHLDETAIFFAPYVNSYKRHLAVNDDSGGINAWSTDNRTVTLRIVGNGDSLHLEHRYPGADVNPYLATAAIIAGGLDGIQRDLDPGRPFTGNAYGSDEVRWGPRCLGEALQAFTSSPFILEAFGPEVLTHYAARAESEWMAYLSKVTDWEVMRAFELA